MHKYLFICLTLLGSLTASRADLALQQKADDGKHFRDLSILLHGDKMRLDVERGTNAIFVIVDLGTRDSLTLMPATKTYIKRTGTELKQLAETRRKAAGTNALDMDALPVPAVPTGKTEKIDGLDTEIYTWSGGHKLEETLWVAKDYPNYKLIQPELAKVDAYNRDGAHRNGQPEMGRLPGMVVRVVVSADGEKGTNTLVSAKVDPLDAALFELPADYTAYKATPLKPTQTPTP
jgi:hypothetical protein